MEHAEQTLLNQVEQRLKALDTNAFAVEKAAGLPIDAVRSILRGGKKSGTTLNRAKEVCEALGIEFYIGPPRETGPYSAPPTASADDFAQIPLHAALLAAGDGRENGTEEIIEYLAFRRDWLRKVGIAPGNAALARVDGESMQPSIWHGDMVMIDRSRVEVPVRARATESRHRSPVYALLEDGKARVKRIERPSADQLVLISDNPDFAPQFVHIGTVTVVGKVIWSGHTW